MNVKNIILGCFVLLILIILYYWFFNDTSKVNLFGIKKADELSIISGDKAPFNQDWTWSFWVHISNYNYSYGKKKHILFRKFKDGDEVGANSIYLDEYQSDLVIDTSTTGTGAGHEKSTCKIENIPLQRWTHVLVSYRSRALDVYIDGKLVKSCVLKGNFYPPEDLNGKILFSPSEKDIYSEINKSGETVDDHKGFRGMLGTVRYYKKAVQAREAYEIYKEGYSGGNWLSDLFNKYKLKIAFLEDNEEMNSFLF
jgi:hypothetical protein